MPPQQYSPDPSLVQAILIDAKKFGARADVLLATALVENSGHWKGAAMDTNNAVSAGPYQLNAKGQLSSAPGRTLAEKIKAAQSPWVVAFKARQFAHLGITGGRGAAIAQGPANPGAYAAKVDSLLPEARRILAHAGGKTTGPNALQTHSNGIQNRLVKEAQHFVQIQEPYSWGGGSLSGPTTGIAQGAHTVGFDCSAFVRYLYHKVAGITLPRTAAAQFNSGMGTKIGRNQLHPGDPVFFAGTHGAGISHEGIYIGGNNFIHEPHTGGHAEVSSLNDPYYAQHFAGGLRIIHPSKSPAHTTASSRARHPMAVTTKSSFTLFQKIAAEIEHDVTTGKPLRKDIFHGLSPVQRNKLANFYIMLVQGKANQDFANATQKLHDKSTWGVLSDAVGSVGSDITGAASGITGIATSLSDFFGFITGWRGVYLLGGVLMVAGGGFLLLRGK